MFFLLQYVTIIPALSLAALAKKKKTDVLDFTQHGLVPTAPTCIQQELQVLLLHLHHTRTVAQFRPLATAPALGDVTSQVFDEISGETKVKLKENAD